MNRSTKILKIKQNALMISRKLRLMHLLDKVRFYYFRVKNKKINDEFKRKNPDVKLPPDYLIYESFQLNYHKYYFGGRENAAELKTIFEKHIQLKDALILDWGCGPGRIIRHMPEVINNGCKFYGTDYNERSIEWCKAHLTSISFNKNSLEPNLPYEEDLFDVIYGISIITHLSEKYIVLWIKELLRVLKPNGILIITTHGENFVVKLTANEQATFRSGKLVVRSEVKEGHRTYATFHPKEYIYDLFKNEEVVEHIEEKDENSIPQDIWIIRKK